MSILVKTVFVAGVIAATLALSYGFAALGEPQSVWLWCDMIGVCP